MYTQFCFLPEIDRKISIPIMNELFSETLGRSTLSLLFVIKIQKVQRVLDCHHVFVVLFYLCRFADLNSSCPGWS